MDSEVRFVVETALDIHVVSSVAVEGDFVNLKSIEANGIQTIRVPRASILSITKETIQSEDITDSILNKEVLEVI